MTDLGELVEAGSDDKAVYLGRRCIVCNADAWLVLPIPRLGHSMLSDGGDVPHPLKKCSCSNCGLAQHIDALQDGDIQNYFGSSYSLSDHQPNIGFEGGRQKQYAEWIISSIGNFSPDSVLELGCGNGSLMSELMTRLPSARFIGLESSDRGVKWAQDAGLPVHRAYVMEENSVKGYRADLVLSINVIEHTLHPAGFMRAARAAINDKGFVVLVCPDGSEVGSELLIFDHLYSFCPSNLIDLARKAGLFPIHHRRSPPELPGFQMVIAAANSQEQVRYEGDCRFAKLDVRKLHAARVSYLTKWKRLDRKLCESMSAYWTTAVFGVGEMARLIRAYAPSAWDLVSHFVVDGPVETEFFGRAVIPYTEFKPNSNEVVLLAVSWPSVEKISARLKSEGHNVLTLDDLSSPSEC